MSITKLAPVGNWASAQLSKTTRDLAHVTASSAPRRIITGMLTGGPFLHDTGSVYGSRDPRFRGR